ncbi:MAG: MFS transporter [Gaiellales bacterium]
MSEAAELRPSYRALFQPERRALVLGGLGASFLASLDLLLVVTALPSAARDLGGIGGYAFAAAAYAVAQVTSQPIGGALSDRAGPWRTLLVGSAIFAVGTAIGGSASSLTMIAVARLVQGFGGGLLLSVPPVLWTLYIPARLQPHAFGLNAAVWGISALIGPPVGALLTGTLGWRFVFWVNVPALVLMLTLGYLGLRGRRPPDATDTPFALVGPALLGLAVLALLTRPLLAIPAAIAFAVSEWRTLLPVVPRTAWGRATCAVALANGFTFLGMEAFLPLDLQSGVGWSVFWASAPLVTASLGWTTGSMIAARLRLSLRTQIGLGSLLVAVGGLTAAVPLGGGLPVALGFTVAGVGMGLASPALFVAVLSDERGAEGRETAAPPVARNVGSSIGIALGGGLLVRYASSATLRAAEHGVAPLGHLHFAARIAYLVLAAGSLAVLPAIAWLRPVGPGYSS